MSNTLPFAHYNSDGSLVADPKEVFDRPKFSTLRPGAIKRIALVGDSLTEINDALGYNPTTSPAYPSSFRNVRVSLNASTAGTASLEHNASTNSIRFKSFGADYSAATDITTGGKFTLTDSLGVTCTLSLIARLYSGTGITTYTLTMAAASWRSGVGALQSALETFYPGRFEFISLGVSGAQSSDVYASRTQVATVNADAVLEQVGTNDLIADLTAEQIVAQRVANWDYFNIILGLPVVAGLIPARWTAGSADEPTYSTARRDVLTTANALLVEAAANRLGVILVNNWTGMVDPSVNTGAARVSWTTDGVHAAGAAVELWAQNFGRGLETLFPLPRLWAVPTGTGNDYSATNPRGNLITSGRGSFTGTGGTANTGVTVAAAWSSGATAAVANTTVVISNSRAYLARTTGTAGTVAPIHSVGAASDGSVLWECISTGIASVGLAAGMSAQRFSGANIVVSAWKETCTDSNGDWQAFYVSGATAANESFRFYNTSALTIANWVAGDIISASCEWFFTELGSASAAGAALEITTTGGPASCVYGSQAITSNVAGTQGTRVVQMRPIAWPESITAVAFRLLTSSNIGGTFVAKLRNLAVVKNTA